MNHILEDYLKSLLPYKEDWIIKMEKQAKAEKIPIMDPVSMHFLVQFVQMTEPKHILEIGTAIGYSTLRMHTGAPDAKITTIEKEASRFEQASEYIKMNKKQDYINIIYGDALEVLQDLPRNTYDLIFIDAAKGQYERFFNLSSSLLTKKGIIVSDNILFRGFVSGEEPPPKRYEKLTKKIQAYNKWLTAHPEFSTSIVPIGDGIAISYRKIT